MVREQRECSSGLFEKYVAVSEKYLEKSKTLEIITHSMSNQYFLI